MITQDGIKFQRERVYNLLSTDGKDGLTRLQIAKELGIERASICRRVAELRDQRRLWVAKIGLCPITNTRAEFLTCSPDVAEKYQAKKETAE